MIRTVTRRATLLGPVLMTLMLVAQPVAASTPISQTGAYGAYEITDFENTQRGANCLYEGHKTNGKNRLDKISIRPPKVYADQAPSGDPGQWVGWRYIIQRDSNFDQVYSDVYVSSFVKDKAKLAQLADFTRRTWTAPEDPKGNYRVRIVIKWFKYGSSTQQSAKVVEQLEWYHLKVGSNASGKVRHNVCYKNYQDA
jgi:hypothetical protein